MSDLQRPLSLFAYGTLVFPEVWTQVTGDATSRRTERAVLYGYSLHRVRDAEFPGIVRSPDTAPVQGLVYHDLDDETFSRLDAFEDSFYERVPVEVVPVDGGASFSCHAYVVPGYLKGRVLAPETWDATEFQSRHLADFARRLRGEFGGNG